MRLDGLLGDEERLGDLGIREPVGRHAGDSSLARGQGVNAGAPRTARPAPCGAELLPSASGQRPGSAGVGQIEGRAQRLAGSGALAHAPDGGAEIRQGSRVLEPGRRAFERLDRLLEQRQALCAPLDQAERVQCHPDRAGRSPGAGIEERSLRPHAGVLRVGRRQSGGAEHGRRERRVGVPPGVPLCRPFELSLPAGEIALLDEQTPARMHDCIERDVLVGLPIGHSAVGEEARRGLELAAVDERLEDVAEHRGRHGEPALRERQLGATARVRLCLYQRSLPGEQPAAPAGGEGEARGGAPPARVIERLIEDPPGGVHSVGEHENADREEERRRLAVGVLEQPAGAERALRRLGHRIRRLLAEEGVEVRLCREQTSLVGGRAAKPSAVALEPLSRPAPPRSIETRAGHEARLHCQCQLRVRLGKVVVCTLPKQVGLLLAADRLQRDSLLAGARCSSARIAADPQPLLEMLGRRRRLSRVDLRRRQIEKNRGPLGNRWRLRQ